MMLLTEAQQKFIEAWGSLGSQWGINRTMAQIHAYLLLHPKPQSAEDIMKGVTISRGNANMNLRSLLDWGLVHKQLIPGERKEFFVAEQDIWQIARRISAERRKRELVPVQELITQLQQVSDGPEEDRAHFLDFMKDLQEFVEMSNKLLERFEKGEQKWLQKKLFKILT